MKELDVRKMACGVFFQKQLLKGTVEETHISWVILTQKFVFKIKKPVRFSFLDFSTLELRRHYCHREVELNSRYSNIYLTVMPICDVDGQWYVGDQAGEVVDYCVVMKRMDVSKRMDSRLRNHAVDEQQMETLGVEVAAFHNKADKIFNPFSLALAQSRFNDIGQIKNFVKENIAYYFGDIIDKSIEYSDDFLHAHEARFQRRIDHGLKRDVHGDLHSQNIFLYRSPVIFDCIEFNDQYRQIDVLYEIAFLCMDLEAHHQKHLAEKFLSEYRKHFPAFQVKEDYDLFVYFKSLRANIRAKVHAISAGQADTQDERTNHTAEAKRYLTMMNKYVASLQVTLMHTF